MLSLTPHQSGFSLVELIMTLVLIGILSALGIGLFASNSGFSAYLARDALISSALLAQKKAMANQFDTDVVTLTIRQTPGEWIFNVAQGVSWSQTQSAERSGAALRVEGGLLANAGTHTVSYSADGSTGQNLNLQFEGERTHPLCIASTGFAYAGVCAE